MAKSGIASSVFILWLALVLSVCAPTKAATYIVGGFNGWIPEVLGKAYYVNWCAAHTFHVGDVLVFNIPLGGSCIQLIKTDNGDGTTTTSTRSFPPQGDSYQLDGSIDLYIPASPLNGPGELLISVD